MPISSLLYGTDSGLQKKNSKFSRHISETNAAQKSITKCPIIVTNGLALVELFIFESHILYLKKRTVF